MKNPLRTRHKKSDLSDMALKAEEWRKKYLVIQYQLDAQFNYQKWLATHKLSYKQLEAQKEQAAKLKYRPLVSVLLPVYKPPIELLKECLESVVNQTYDNWQICVVDDKSESPEINKLLNEYSTKHGKKFLYKKRLKNGHISLASNDALNLATGEFVALLDHDDILWPNALFEVVSLLNKNKGTDFIYTDEDKLEQGAVNAHPYMKPSYDKVFLSGCNYITHLAVIRTAIVREVGGFRKGLEGAQDWDLFLRISQHTNKIVHLPKLLYSWRVIEASTAKRGFDAKPYAYDAQQKAATDYYQQAGVPIGQAVLPPGGFVGWMASFKLRPTTLTVILKGYTSAEDARRIISRIEDMKDDKITTNYVLIDCTFKRLRLNRKVALESNINTAEINTDFVLCVTNLFDVQGPSGWLENMIGYLMLPGNKIVTAPIKYSDHFIASAGIAFTKDNEPFKILSNYYHGCDERLDTALMSPRSVQSADNRIFMCSAVTFHSIRKTKTIPIPESTKHKGVIYAPFVNFFVNDTNRLQKDAFSIDDFVYDVAEDSPYWGKNYLR